MSDSEHLTRLLARQQFTLSCVVPVFNEEGIIARFLAELHATIGELTHAAEIIVVNDGSRDGSRATILRAAQRLPIRYLEFSRNFGKEAAIQAGLDAARGDCVVILDADFQHPLDLIRSMVERWRSGVDVVYGVRLNRAREPLWRRVGTRLYYRLMRRLSGVDIPADAGDFRLLDARVVAAICRLPERNRYMKGLYAWVGFDSEPIGYHAPERPNGHSRFRALDLFELAMTGLTGFSTRPLRLIAGLGFITSALALLFGAYVVAERLLFGQEIAGFTTLVAAIVFLGGAQLIAFGVFGEYVGRIFEEVKARPLYITALDLDRSPLRASAAGTGNPDQVGASGVLRVRA